MTPTTKPDPTAPFAIAVAAIRKATNGRKSSPGSLTGPERRRTVRILERRERRLAGQQAGFTAPSLSARRLAPSGYMASFIAEATAVADVPQGEKVAALRDLAAFDTATPEV